MRLTLKFMKSNRSMCGKFPLVVEEPKDLYAHINQLMREYRAKYVMVCDENEREMFECSRKYSRKKQYE